MKTRNGFVSNSSSSSYIIAIKVSKKCECCGRSDPDILTLIEAAEAYNDDNSVKATDEDVIKHIEEYFEYDNKTMEEIKSKINKAIKNGLKVAEISISYHNDAIKEIFESMKNAGTIELIYGYGD